MNAHPTAVPRLTPVPRQPDGLGPDVLTRVLPGGGAEPSGARVAGVRWERIGQDRGFTGVVARGHVAWEPAGAGPASVVAKFPLPAEDTSGYRQVMRGRSALRRLHTARAVREAWFYENVAPVLPVRVPRCWAVGADVEDDRLVLLLEDVGGGYAGDALTGCSPADAARVLEAVAPLHAAFWADGSRLARTAPWAGTAAERLERQQRFTRRWRTLVDSGVEFPRRIRHMAEDLGGRLAAVLDRLDAAPHTLLHADLHLDNVLFTSPDEVVVLDWQSVSRGPAVADIAPFIATSLTPQDRHDHQEELLVRYTGALTAGGVPAQDAERVRQDFVLALLVRFAGVVGWRATTNTVRLEGREAALAEAALGDGRLTSALLANGADTLLRQM